MLTGHQAGREIGNLGQEAEMNKTNNLDAVAQAVTRTIPEGFKLCDRTAKGAVRMPKGDKVPWDCYWIKPA